MRPLYTVEKHAFKSLIRGYTQQNDIYIPDRRTITKELEKWYANYCTELKCEISKQKHLCTTADI